MSKLAGMVKSRPPQGTALDADEAQPRRPRLVGRRLAIAFAVAALADALSIVFTFTPPVQWGADVITATLLFVVLGWQWALLPALVMETIPGLYVFPFWVLVVGAVAIWGTVRPTRKSVSAAAGNDVGRNQRLGDQS